MPQERRIVLPNEWGLLGEEKGSVETYAGDIPRMLSVFPTRVHCSLALLSRPARADPGRRLNGEEKVRELNLCAGTDAFLISHRFLQVFPQTD